MRRVVASHNPTTLIYTHAALALCHHPHPHSTDDHPSGNISIHFWHYSCSGIMVKQMSLRLLTVPELQDAGAE